jgi:hypothetical protein
VASDYPGAGLYEKLRSASGNDRAAQLARDLIRKATAAEPKGTDDLREIGISTGTKVDGAFTLEGKKFSTLDTRLKTVESIASRIRRDMKDGGLTADEAAEDIKDDLRYTFVISPSSYGNDIAAITQLLISKGYRPRRIKNFWMLTEGYAGINSSWQTPDGKWFEIQFHTQRTLETKEIRSHQLYEQLRLMTPESDAWVEIEVEIERIWREVRASPPSMSGLDEATRHFP